MDCLAIEPGVDGGGFEGGDGDEDASPGVEEGDSELDDKDSEFSTGSSVSDESSQWDKNAEFGVTCMVQERPTSHTDLRLSPLPLIAFT